MQLTDYERRMKRDSVETKYGLVYLAHYRQIREPIHIITKDKTTKKIVAKKIDNGAKYTIYLSRGMVDKGIAPFGKIIIGDEIISVKNYPSVGWAIVSTANKWKIKDWLFGKHEGKRFRTFNEWLKDNRRS